MQGTVFAPVQFESDSISGTEAEQLDILPRQANLGVLSAVVHALMSGSVKPLFEPAEVNILFYTLSFLFFAMLSLVVLLIRYLF